MKLELSELATCLDLPLNTVERWIRQGRIPIRKSGSRCIFKKAVLVKWAKKHDILFTPPAEHQDVQGEDAGDSLVGALKRGGVHHNVTGKTVEDVLKSATNLMPEMEEDERGLLFSKLIERESLTSTGIGKGVAIPHPRTPLPGSERLPIVSTCFLKHKVDFNSIDDKPVSVMFVIVCPSVKTHLNLLSKISYCVRDDEFVDFLNASPDPDHYYQKIEDLEKQLDKGR